MVSFGQQSFLSNPGYQWQTQQENGISCHYRGERSVANDIVKLISLENNADKLTEKIEECLSGLKDYTSGVVETPELIVAWVDHIRSWPVYYSYDEDQIYISNDARKVKEHAKLIQIDEAAAIEFAMSGYVTGKNTLYSSLFSLQPGEFLVWRKSDKKPLLKRYYRYIPDLKQKAEWTENQQALGGILDSLTHKIIERANGRTIWVPLSAGLDSRILLCKLHEHGYQRIKTFTYGPRYNFEAKHAKKIAERLSLPWQMIELSTKELRACFDDEQRKKFWDYADGLKSIPCMREYSAIHALHKSGEVKEGDIFLNGQSGDYITGGHIAPQLLRNGTSTADDFFNALIDKHYDLWSSLKTEDNIALMRERIASLLPEGFENTKANIDWATYAEMWEYDGRQVCYVVNGQRVYEFFGYDWEMPLWEKTLVDFCQNLPLEQKAEQALYKSYLRDYNYKGLFPSKEPYIWRWPMPMLWVVPIARLIGVFAGAKAKRKFYDRMRYYGHYANQYVFFPLSDHKKTYKNARNVISLHVRKWVWEEKSLFDANISKSLSIKEE
ncbi:MAG: asparagine synthase [Alphaproteobacteria bacterium]|nr:asparagine synthase [Alphaproteobacteria bacterium]